MPRALSKAEVSSPASFCNKQQRVTAPAPEKVDLSYKAVEGFGGEMCLSAAFGTVITPLTAFPLHIAGKESSANKRHFQNPHLCTFIQLSSVIKGFSYCSTHPKTAGGFSLSPDALTLWTLHFQVCTVLVSPEQHRYCVLN